MSGLVCFVGSSASENRFARTVPAWCRRAGAVFGGAVLAFAVFGSSGAQAQNCVSDNGGSVFIESGGLTFGPFLTNNMGAFSASIAGNLGAAINTANSAFLTQSSAFVGSPANPKPDQPGGGVWVRGVGGEVDEKSASTSSFNLSIVGIGSGTDTVHCDSKVHESFAGIQVGQDLARLNVNGWNLQIGLTAGTVGTSGNETGGVATFGGVPFTNSVQVPFIGSYVAVNNGGFFADALLRGDFFQADLNSPALNIDNQSLNARGITVGGTMGYQYRIPDSSWFVEPSGGLIYSHVQVDPFNSGGVPGAFNTNIQGTLQLNDIVSTTGRVGLRVGEAFEASGIVWTPFAAISGWSDFGASVKGTYSTCGSPSSSTLQNCMSFLGGLLPAQATSNFTGQGVGTYGQYSIGVSAQIANTGWLGFTRVDFRDGDRLEGWDVTGGIRYQFTPELPLAAKVPIYKATPAAEPYNWTGLYVGGVLGADAGWSREDFGGVFSPLFNVPANSIVPGFPPVNVPGGGVGDVGPRVAGLLGGAEIGYNYQIGKWLLGVEGDLTDSNTKGSRACTDLSTPGIAITTLPPQHPLWDSTCDAQATWIGTVTGRVGVEWWDRALLYAKGGVAFTHETFSANCNLGPLNGEITPQSCYNPAGALLSDLTGSTNAVGGTVGLGTEFALTKNWSAKAEWDYINFGNRSITASDGTVINSGMSLNEVKIGANYHFTP
jgi:outer membrane autotransporter protein